MIKRMVEGLSKRFTKSIEITPTIELLSFRIVNAFLIGAKGSEDWVLIDTGLTHSYDFIIERAEARYGLQPPKAILLTHGHFDHVGSLEELSHHWPVPIYVHPRERDFITGEAEYPEADPTVSSGLIAKLSPYLTNGTVDVSYQAEDLPEDGSVPHLPGWRWIHTPGHTLGHVCYYEEETGILIAGDALTTTKQESLLSVIRQDEEVNGPPLYLTHDMDKALISIEKIMRLEPKLVLPSHGKPIEGEDLLKHYDKLLRDPSNLKEQLEEEKTLR